MQLHTSVHHLALQVGTPVLGHAGSGRVQLVKQQQFGAFVHKHLRDLHLGLQLGQGEAGVLKRGHCLAKHLALLDKVHGPANGSKRCSHRPDGDLQTLPRQLFHQTDKAFVDHVRATQQSLGGQTHIVEKQLAGILGFEPQLFQRLAFGETGCTCFQQKQAGSLGPCGGVGFGNHDDQIRMPSVGDVGFAAIEHKGAIRLHHSRGFDALQIAACRRFGHGNGADHVATRHGG